MQTMDRPGLTELKQRLWFVAGALVVYRIGAHIPVPGLDPIQLAALFAETNQGILGLFNMFSGGALSRLTIFALGIMPYISASIIVQLLSSVLPYFEQLKKEGENGRRQLSQYTRYGTIALATVHAIGMARYLATSGVALEPTVSFYGITVLTLVTGTLFLMWLGEKITERGIGNGISLIIFAGIVAGLPSAIATTFEQLRQGVLQPVVMLMLTVLFFGVIAFIVFMERAQRRIPVNYARHQQGGQLFAAQQSHLPLKLNIAGVMPPIFASMLIVLPGMLSRLFGQSSESLRWLLDVSLVLEPGQPLYIMLFGASIFGFCFFCTSLFFNAKDTAENLKRSGAFIPGIRPGEQTAKYVDLVVTRLALIGGVYIVSVALLPEFLILGWQVPFYFGGTSLLIVVVVMMDTMAQIQSHLISRQYEGLLKKGMGKKKDGRSKTVRF